MPKFRNSEYTVEFKYRRLLEPRSESELAAIIKNANQEGRKIKIVGGSHSFSHIGKTDDTLVDLSKISEFCSLIDVDQNEKSAVLGGGMQLGDAIEALHAHDLHFPSLGSWYSQTIGGALATAVHGSSLEYGTLSDLVEELWAITASGDSIHLKNNDSGLAAWRVSLGLLGVVTKVKFRLKEAFYLKSDIKDIEDDEEGFKNLYKILDDWDSQQTPYLNHLWLPYSGRNGRTLTRKLTFSDEKRPNRRAKAIEKRWALKDGNTLFNGAEDRGMLSLSKSFLDFPKIYKNTWSNKLANAFLEDNGVIDRSFRVFLYDQYREPTENHWMRLLMNAEYALDISQVESVVHEIRDLLRNLYQEGRVINFPRFHLRFAPASTNTLLGMNQGRKTCFFAHYGSGATKPWKQIDIFKNIERILDSHGGRPHWGKTRYLGQDTKFYSYYDGNYEKFESYRKKLDPNSVFSDGLEMFKGINLFEKRKFLQKPFSGWNKNNYFPIRFLGGRSSKL